MTSEANETATEQTVSPVELCRNISNYLYEKLKPREEYDDSANAYLYILFVLMFYAISIVVLMVKYIRREKESVHLEYYYNEFVKREAFQVCIFDHLGRLKKPLVPRNADRRRPGGARRMSILDQARKLSLTRNAPSKPKLNVSVISESGV